MVDIAKAILLGITARTFMTRTRDLFSAMDIYARIEDKNTVYYV
jgi:hypothetical protein